MQRAEWIGLLIVVTVLAFQTRTTLRVWRSKLFDRSQKVAQSQLIWLLPLIGAVIVMSVLQDEVERGEGSATWPRKVTDFAGLRARRFSFLAL